MPGAPTIRTTVGPLRPAGDAPPRHGGRRVLVGVLVVVACAALVVATAAVAAERTVLDTDRFAGAVERSLDDPAVTDAMAGVLADQVVAALAASGTVARLVPDALDPLAPVLERAIRGFVVEEAAALLASERGRGLLVEVVRVAHAAALRIVEGAEPDARGLVLVDDERVALNLVPLIAAILGAAQRGGIVDGAGPIPELDADAPVGDQLDRLGEALGADLEPTFGQLTVYERRAAGATSPVGGAQRLLELLRVATVLWLLAAVLLAVAALALSTDRVRTATWLLGGLAVGALVAFLLVRRVVAAVPDAVEAAAARPAVEVVAREALDGVLRALAWVAALAAVAAGVVTAPRSPVLRGVPLRFPNEVRAVATGLAVLLIVWLGARAVTVTVAVLLVAVGWWLPARASARSGFEQARLSGPGRASPQPR